MYLWLYEVAIRLKYHHHTNWYYLCDYMQLQYTTLPFPFEILIFKPAGHITLLISFSFHAGHIGNSSKFQHQFTSFRFCSFAEIVSISQFIVVTFNNSDFISSFLIFIHLPPSGFEPLVAKIICYVFMMIRSSH